jgi:hypothetical protein
MKYVLILAALAYVLESVGPWLLEKFFPQSLLAPAPDVTTRPKRTASRQDAYVDEAMGLPGDIQTLSNARQEPTGLVAEDSTGYAPPLVVADAEFDYDEFRPAARDDLSNGRAGKAESASIRSVQGGVPDIFDDEGTSAHA